MTLKEKFHFVISLLITFLVVNTFVNLFSGLGLFKWIAAFVIALITSFATSLIIRRYHK